MRLANQFLCALHNPSFGERGIMAKILFMQQSQEELEVELKREIKDIRKYIADQENKNKEI